MNFNEHVMLWCADQFEVMQEELYRRRDECVQLRAALASRDNQSAENIVNPLLGSEDVELKMAYNSQRDLKRSIVMLIYALSYMTNYLTAY